MAIPDLLNLIEEELNSESLFQDEYVFSPNYLPDILPHRENELRILASYFRTVFRHPEFSTVVSISGFGRGIGKTALSKVFGKTFEEAARKVHKNLKYVHMNCRNLNKPQLILTQILGLLIPYFPIRGFSVPELLRMLQESLSKKQLTLILALDDIEALLKERGGYELVYNLVNLNNNSVKGSYGVSVIAISNTPRVADLLEEISSRFSQNKVELNPYSSYELKTILWERTMLGIGREKVQVNLIPEIAAFTAGRGSAREAIDLLWLAAKRADYNKSKMVMITDLAELLVNTPEMNKIDLTSTLW
ncbi:MAG: Cdc6/Cdc18 family protein [Candidatus Hodarchaeota archaeon]